MKMILFIKEKQNVFVVNILCMILLSAFLRAVKNNMGVIIIILIFWFLILFTYIYTEFISRKKHFEKLLDTLYNLDNKYLISEVMEKPYHYEDLLYYQILKTANKSMLEHITEIKHERREYKEYIEGWVHEIKTPISAMKLICENNKSDVTRKLLIKLNVVDNYVEQALFYARSENVEKDYFVKEIELSLCVNNVIINNKQLLIQNNIKIEIVNCENAVYTDSKWLEFILNQLIINSIKYKNGQAPVIKIYSEKVNNGIALNILDNGIGIADSEITRVFDKGFTGTNGRKLDNSTGIGLYLCKRLCCKLGLEIGISSEINNYTMVTVFFPKGTFLSLL